ncbi:MAG: protein tyrosine phosphatase, partial [Bryobacteraceae bacterium]
AFGYAGRPYDFNFDFLTDAALVCTELVYKSYEPAADMRGLRFPLVDVMGRKVTPANLLVRQFDEQFGTARQQFDLVLFLDGVERARKAIEASIDAFRASWKRPKWHILTER